MNPIPRTTASLLLMLMLMSSALSAQVVMGDNLGAIPDGGLPGASGGGNFGPPRDVTFNVTGRSGTVSTLTVGFDADHSFVGDLRVTLIAPNGVPHILFSRTGATTATGFGADANLMVGASYTFNDTATTNWWTHVANNATDVPGVSARTTTEGGAGVASPAAVTSLDAAFASTPPNGIWTLRFEDGGPGDIGNVTRGVLLLVTSGGNREVTTDADSGPGSLRQAITDAAPGDLISFASPFFDTSRIINLLTALPVINRAMAIQGPGAHRLTVRRADDVGDFRVFEIDAGSAAVTLSGLQISNGRTNSFGGGISAVSPLTLTDTQLSGNRAGNGGGLAVSFTGASIFNSTISGNRSQFQAGGIYYLAGGPSRLKLIGSTISDNEAGSFPGGIFNLANAEDAVMEIVNSTIAGNRAAEFEGGILTQTQGTALASRVTLRNSIVVDNLPANFGTAPDVGTATISSQGFNLSNDFNGPVTLLTSDLTGDARLGPLALYGGSVPTQPLLGGSLALDNGNASAGLSLGAARGEPRTFDIASIANSAGGNGADIGAVEMQAIFVSSASDAGVGSLRQAITDANGNGAALDDILFAQPLFANAQTIDLGSALPNIASSLAVHGPGANLLNVRRNAVPEFSVFVVNGGLPHVALQGLTISNGVGAFGGGVNCDSPLTLAESVVSGNVSDAYGGGVAIAFSDAWVLGSTIVDNSTNQDGGGIGFQGDGNHRLHIEGSTISGNAAALRGGGVSNLSLGQQSRVEIVSSTIAGNTATVGFDALVSLSNDATADADTSLRNSIVTGRPGAAVLGIVDFVAGGQASITSRGFNLANNSGDGFLDQSSDQLNATAGLAPLADNGGPTPTHALMMGSDALDGGSAEGSSALTDQRSSGFTRTVDLSLPNTVGGDGTDVGAFESQTGILADGIFSDGFEGS